MSKKWTYLFSEGNADMRALLGGKGANLAEMTNLGLPVPYGFTVTTEACTQYYTDGKTINDEIIDQIFEYLGISKKLFKSVVSSLIKENKAKFIKDSNGNFELHKI